jgi:uncharacterized protein YndB with AHSA1/START domain
MAAWQWHSEWMLAAPVDAVWQAIAHPETWPAWWPYVAYAKRLCAGDANDVGARYRFVWRTRLPYQIRFDTEVQQVEEHRLLVARALGEVVGTGTWQLAPCVGGTRVAYDWHIELASGWKRVLAPVLAAVYQWNHDGVMRAGQAGLARYLETQHDPG